MIARWCAFLTLKEWEGFEAKLELNQMVEGAKRFRGVLAGVDGENVAFDIDGESETALFPYAWISSAKLMLTDALIDASLKAAKADQNLKEIFDGDDQ